MSQVVLVVAPLVVGAVALAAAALPVVQRPSGVAGALGAGLEVTVEGLAVRVAPSIGRLALRRRAAIRRSAVQPVLPIP